MYLREDHDPTMTTWSARWFISIVWGIRRRETDLTSDGMDRPGDHDGLLRDDLAEGGPRADRKT